MLQHLRHSVQVVNCSTWSRVFYQAHCAADELMLQPGYYCTAAQQQQEQQQPQADVQVTSNTAVILEDMNKYLDSSGELTFFDEPLELQQHPGAAGFGEQPIPKPHNSSSGSSSSIVQAAALEGLSIHRKVKQSRSNLIAARQMKAAVFAMRETNEDAAVKRRRSRRQQQEQHAGADAADAPLDSDAQAATTHTAAGETSQVQESQPPQKERQIVADLGQQALVQYRRSMAAQHRQVKSMNQKLQLLHQAWKDAEPPGVLDGGKVVSSFEAAVQFNVQYRALLEDIKQQQQQQQQSWSVADDASADAVQGSSSTSSGKASTAPAAAAAAASTSLELGAWRRTRESVLQQMKVKELQAVLDAAGCELPPNKAAKSKKALMQIILDNEASHVEALLPGHVTQQQ